MGILTVEGSTEKQSNADVLLERTFALPEPLGIPVEYIEPDSCKLYEEPVLLDGVSPFSSLMRKKLEVQPIISRAVDNTVRKKDLCHEKKGDLVSHLSAEVAKLGSNPDHRYNSFTTPLCTPGYKEYAHHYSPSNYKAPSAAFIITQPASVSSTDVMRYWLDAPDLGGFSSKSDLRWRAKLLWHEIGHAAGGAEPQAEAVSAVMDRKENKDSSTTRSWGDFRTLRAVFCGSIKILNKYGLPTWEVNDLLGRVSQYTIDGMGDADIKSISFQKFNHMSERVLEVGRRLEASVGKEAFKKRHFGAIEQAAIRECRYKPHSRVEKQISLRVALACARIPKGDTAYHEGEMHIPDELLESEYAKPLSFVPGEFIPE